MTMLPAYRAALVTWVTSQRECCWDTNPSSFTSAYQTNRTAKSPSTSQLIFRLATSKEDMIVCILNAAFEDTILKYRKYTHSCEVLIKLLTFLELEGEISVLNLYFFSTTFASYAGCQKYKSWLASHCYCYNFCFT